MRPKGAGGVGYRADRKRWYYRWSEHGVPHVGYTETEADALRMLAAATTARDAGRKVVTRRYDLARFLPAWLDSVTGITDGSRIKYRYAAAAWMADPIAHVKLADLDGLMVRKTIKRWQDAGVSASAIRMRLTILKMALDVARVDGHVADNVARPPYVKAPPVPKARIVPPTPAEIEKLRAAIAGHEFEAAFVLALEAGMRQGEILALRWRHVTIGPETRIKIVGTVAYGTDSVGKTKTEHSTREIYVSDAARDALIRQRDRAPMDASSDDDFVFWYVPTYGRHDGKPGHILRANLLGKHWRAICMRTLGRTYRFHDLRHVFITSQIERGQPIALVSRYVGHSNIDMTVDRYGHMKLAKPV